MEVEAAASETETGPASRAAPPLLLLDGCARAPPPGSLKAAGVRDGDMLGALVAVTWCPTCNAELGGEHWSCPGCGQDAEALSRAAHCSNVALVDLVTERALAPQTASFAEGWVCSQCLFYNPWQLTHLSTLPSKDKDGPLSRESRQPPQPPATSASATAATAAAPSAAATAAAPSAAATAAATATAAVAPPTTDTAHAGRARTLQEGGKHINLKVALLRTPEDLDMEDGDVIDALVEQRGSVGEREQPDVPDMPEGTLVIEEGNLRVITTTSAAPATPPHKLYAVCRLCHNHDALAGAACTAAGLGCPVETPPTPAVAKAASSAEEAPSAEKLKQNAVEEEVERAKRSRALGESQMSAGEYEAAVAAFDEALVVFNMAAGRGCVIGGSGGDAEAAARKAPMLSYTISKDELLSTALPELYCSKAEALLKLGQFEDALEAATQAAGLKPTGARLHCRTHSLAAAALRRLCREDDAAAALQRFERVAQEYAAILAQRPRLLRYQNYHQNGRADHSLAPAPCQPPLGAPAAFPPRAVQSGLLPAAAGRASRVDSLLLAVFNEEDVRGELLCAMSLHSKRASCCCCSTLRSHVSANLHAPSLSVRIEDATFDNAAFVGRLPRLGTLHVQGEAFLSDGVDLNKLRSLNRIATGSLSFEAALFVGAALSGGEHTLRLSSGACVALPPLRTRERVNLAHRQLRDKDLAVLLGALSLNQQLKELDLNEPRGANAIMYTSNLRAAMVAALPWPLLRCKGTMRFDLADDKPTLY